MTPARDPSRLEAIPFTPPAKVSSSSARRSVKPATCATPLPTETTRGRLPRPRSRGRTALERILQRREQTVMQVGELHQRPLSPPPKRRRGARGSALDHLVERRLEPVEEPRGRPFDRLLADGETDPQQQVGILGVGHLDVAPDAVVDRAGDVAAHARPERHAALDLRLRVAARGAPRASAAAFVFVERREAVGEGAAACAARSPSA
jgi:hypothetical protein